MKLYIAYPGMAELILLGKLEAIAGIQITLWPGPGNHPDVYDLAIHLDDRETWAVDVKDHHQPFRLGDVTHIDDVFGNETRRFLAVPSWRMSRADYRSRAEAVTRCNPIELIDTDSLAGLVARHAKKLGRATT